MKFANEPDHLGTMNLAVSSPWPMIDFVGFDEPIENELPAVIPAEGPIFRVGLGHSAACAEARSICASLAAAPFLPPSVGRFAITVKALFRMDQDTLTVFLCAGPR